MVCTGAAEFPSKYLLETPTFPHISWWLFSVKWSCFNLRPSETSSICPWAQAWAHLAGHPTPWLGNHGEKALHASYSIGLSTLEIGHNNIESWTSRPSCGCRLHREDCSQCQTTTNLLQLCEKQQVFMLAGGSSLYLSLKKGGNKEGGQARKLRRPTNRLFAPWLHC